MIRTFIQLVESGRVPDVLCRAGIRSLLRRRLKQLQQDSRTGALMDARQLVTDETPIAPVPEAANAQHYELPPEFFVEVLGPHLKYSGCYWPEGVANLEESEAAMLALYCERAEIADGQTILDLGCGWGSLSLWLAAHYPGARITALSNSKPQGDFIRQRATKAGATNLTVVTADMNTAELNETYDRILSIEMFEHMRNYDRLLHRIAGWLKPDGRLFVHHFCHRTYTYPFVTRGPGDWMAEHFFTGGIMPSANLLKEFDRDLRCEKQWLVDGTHYARSAAAWLKRMDEHTNRILPILRAHYGADEVQRWLARWRLFFMACEELFGYNGGSEWLVAHYRFAPSKVSG